MTFIADKHIGKHRDFKICVEVNDCDKSQIMYTHVDKSGAALEE